MKEKTFKFEQVRKEREQEIAERRARAAQAAFEGDYDARIEDAKRAGFEVGVKVRRSFKPESEIGEVVGFVNRDRAMVIQAKFGENEFPYTIEELEIIKD